MSHSSDQKLCCKTLDSLRGKSRPFAEIMALDFYDGPVSGLMRCQDCQSVFRFELLAWDETQETRVFALAKLPNKVFNQMVELYSYDQPQFPVWVPKWQEISDQARRHRDKARQSLLEQKGEWAWIALMFRYGEVLFDVMPAGEFRLEIDRQLNEDEQRQDWLALFGKR